MTDFTDLIVILSSTRAGFPRVALLVGNVFSNLKISRRYVDELWCILCLSCVSSGGLHTRPIGIEMLPLLGALLLTDE